jgi:hypothetical protein
MATKTSFICLIKELGEFQNNLTEIALTTAKMGFRHQAGRQLRATPPYMLVGIRG